jgi:hypothetical protein
MKAYFLDYYVFSLMCSAFSNSLCVTYTAASEAFSTCPVGGGCANLHNTARQSDTI